MNDFAARATELTSKLTLEQKVALLTGRDFWNTLPIDEIGLRNMLLSDGPSGVRGEFWDERDNSLNLPSASALGSTWSGEIAAEYGRVMAREADRKGVDVVLGPTINLHRSPFGGRHFECLSEDAMLTGALATSFVQGIQGLGKGACPKHYIGNDFETDRYTVNVKIDERTLRELYMRPFEDAVVNGKAWSIMSSYNSVNGPTLTESPLLEKPLRTDWGFDGVVISDWTAVRTLESAKFEQDLVMPGPIGPWGEALVTAVRSGEIDETVVDRKVDRILLMAQRVGAIGADGKTPSAPSRHNDISAEGVAFARKAAIAGSVLLRNEGSALPLDLNKVGKVALIGHNADAARTQGGGSATVLPKSIVTPLQALKAALGDRVSYALGAVVQDGIAELDPQLTTNPVTRNRGVQVEFIDAAGNVFYTDERLSTNLVYLGSDAPVAEIHTLRMRTTYTPAATEKRLLGYANVAATKVFMDGKLVVEDKLKPHQDDPFSALMDPPFTSGAVHLEAGVPVEIEVLADMTGRQGLALAALTFTFGFEPDKSDPEGLIAEAVANARASEVAIVVVGTNSKVESEGYDRKSLALPGRQDDLVEAVVAANPNTIVVVNAGSPVELPWRNKVKAILVSYFGGQEMGNALVDILSGAEEPGGRLPTTWAASAEDLPVSNVTPDSNGEVEYTEGIHIGYRAWLKAGTKPAYNFGFGLGYTNWTIDQFKTPALVDAAEDFEVSVAVTNTGARFGKQVVQVYASRKDSKIDRPVRWLAGFAEVHAAPGETKVIDIDVRGREFAHWDGEWKYEAGTFELHVGTSVADIIASNELTLD